MIFLAHAVWAPPVTSNGIHHGAQVQYLDRIAKLVFLNGDTMALASTYSKSRPISVKERVVFFRFADHRSCELLIAFELCGMTFCHVSEIKSGRSWFEVIVVVAKSDGDAANSSAALSDHGDIAMV
ncbi:hypothetical protein BASA83_013245 [Batrachochytrium salamandrivorans]|nr:hypothetical protein BASA83_013245 [Batrachochytrium salamandrivorans]